MVSIHPGPTALRFIAVDTIIDLAIIVASTYVILIVTKTALSRLQKKEIVSSTAVEQVYKLFSLIMYTIMIVAILYSLTSAHEVFYVLIVLLISILLSNWRIIANVTAYYIILITRQPYKSAPLIELPSLNLKGKIMEISPLYTKIKTTDGKLIYIPNTYLLSTTIIQPTSIKSTLSITIEIDVPEGEQGKSVEKAEKMLRTILEKFHITPQPRDLVLKITALRNNRVRIRAEIPIAGVEPRPGVANLLLSYLYNELAGLKPTISIEE